MFDLEVSTRNRKCSFCPDVIEKQQHHFVQTLYDKDTPYPIKKNICKDCARKVTDQEFLGYIADLHRDLVNLHAQRERYADSHRL